MTNQQIVDENIKNIKENIVWKTDVEKMVSMGQVDSLITVMRQTGGIDDHWDLSAGRPKLYKMTQRQYQWLKEQVFGKRMTKINIAFSRLNIPRK